MTPRSILIASLVCSCALPAAGRTEELPAIVLASADCSRASAAAAAQTGGRVLTVSSRTQDGKAVCVVTVIVPSSDGSRPRKQILVMPQ